MSQKIDAETKQDAVDEQNPDTHPTPEQAIDRNPGSGSLSKQEAWASESAQSRSPSNDGRYDTRTTFYYNGDSDDPQHMRSLHRHQQHRDPSDRRSWETLAQWNDGMRDIDGSRRKENFDADVRRWVQTFGNQLDCNGNQIERIEYIVMDDIDLDTFGRQRVSAEKVILGVLSLVVDSDTDADDPESFDLSDWIIYRDRFEELMDAVDMDRDELWMIRKLVHKRSSVFS